VKRLLSVPLILVSCSQPAGPVYEGRSASAWIRDLGGSHEPPVVGNRPINAKAIDALQRIGPAAIPAGLEALTHDRWHVRAGGAHALGLYGAEARTAVPALAAAVTDEHWIVRKLAAEALAKTGDEAKAVIPVLSQNLKHQDVKIRINVAYALAGIDPASGPAFQVLTEELQYVDARFRDAVGGWGENYQKYTRVMEVQKNGQRFLNHENEVRTLAAYTLGALGPAAHRALPELILALRDTNSTAAAYALGQVGSAAAPAIPTLVDRLDAMSGRRGWDEYFFSNASYSVGQIGFEATHLPKLLRILQIPEPRYGQIVNAFAGAPSEAVPELVALLRAKDSDLASRAASALGRMGSRAKPAVPVLVEELEKNRGVRMSAASALAEIGDPDERAIAVLRQLLTDDEQRVRSAAEDALRVLDLMRAGSQPSR
jgi:HEAT repeat protein